MDSFVVRPLDPNQLHAAYPLIRQAAPTVDLGGWRRFAKRAADPRSAGKRGVMVAYRSGNPHPSGLFCYVKEVDLTYGTVLSASHLVVLDMFDPDGVYAALVASLEALGRQLGCKMIRCAPAGGVADAAHSFLEAGHKVDGAVFYKAVEHCLAN